MNGNNANANNANANNANANNANANNANANNIFINNRIQLQPFLEELRTHALLPAEIQHNAIQSAMEYLVTHPHVDACTFTEHLTLSPNWILTNPVVAGLGSFPYEFPRSVDIVDNIVSNVNFNFFLGGFLIGDIVTQYPIVSSMYTAFSVRFNIEPNIQNVTLQYRATMLQTNVRQLLMHRQVDCGPYTFSGGVPLQNE